MTGFYTNNHHLTPALDLACESSAIIDMSTVWLQMF